MRRFSDTPIPDVTSGFRAYSREAALQVQVVSKFTYALETIIQAGKMFVAVDSVPIATNPKTRESRLFSSTGCTCVGTRSRSCAIYTMYEPLRVFAIAAGLVAIVGAAIWVRFIYYFVTGDGHGHVQSLILGSAMLVIAVQLAALGVLADVLAAIRVLLQRSLERIQRLELRLGVEPSFYESSEERAEEERPRATAGSRAGEG